MGLSRHVARRFSGFWIGMALFLVLTVSAPLLAIQPNHPVITSSTTDNSHRPHPKIQKAATPALSAADTAYQAQLQGLNQQRQALVKDQQSLLKKGASAKDLQAWHKKNEAKIASLNQQSAQLAASRPAHQMPYITNITIPADATPEMEALMKNRATLYNNWVQLHNQAIINGATTEGSVAASVQPKAFAQQNAPLLQQQAALAQTVAQQESAKPMRIPTSFPIPANASPQLKTYLTLRNQLMAGEARVHNQNLQADPKDRQAALQQWRAQNKAQFAQMQQAAQNLSSTPSATSN